MTPPSDFSVLENFRMKRIAENRTQNRMLNSCFYLIPREIWI